CSKQKFLISFAPGRVPFRRSSMQKTYWKIPKESCDYCAKQSVLNLAHRCFPGDRVCEKPTESGQNIGMVKWQDRHRSNGTVRNISRCQRGYAKFTSAAVNIMNRYMNTDSIEPWRAPIRGSVRVLHKRPTTRKICVI